MNQQNSEEELLVYGYHPVAEAISTGKPIHKIILQSGDFNEHTKKLWFELKGTDYIVQRWPKFKLDKLTKGNHQGIIAFISPVEFAQLSHVVASVFEQGETPVLCWLDGVSDVRNLGAIMRSAACFGVHAVILPAKAGAILSADVVKSSAGAIYHVPLILSKSTQQTLQELSQLGVHIAAITEKAVEDIEQNQAENPTCLVLGDEGKGISREILEFADAQYKIPMKGGVASLNVSVAAGLVFYEWFRKINS
ncbi:23S rRNA (guanosine(2251)-2'-O)-methyltransferase RlmB [bacterium]|nr:23S rRNA (guanosine(2251)-2'-O)-methyltransferase RlmB [bacterium]